MTLEWRPPYELQNPQVRADQQSAQLNNTLLNVGHMALQNKQYNRQNSLQEAQLAIQQAQEARAKQKWQGEETGTLPGFDASHANQSFDPQGAQPSGGLTQGTMGPQPNYSMQTGQDAFVPQGSITPQPINHSADFMSWKQTGVHPAYAGSQQQNPMSGFDMNSIMRMPGSSNRAEALSFLKDRQTSDLQQSEIEKNRAMAKLYAQGGPGGNKGTWHQNPMTGEMQWYPTVLPPSGGGSSPVPNGSGSNTPANPGQPQLPYKERIKREMEKPKALGSLTNTLREYDNMINEANAIKNDPSLSTATGMTSFTGSIPGTGAKNVSARLETLKAKTLLNVLGSLKQLSANGSSGFGQLSEQEGQAIRNSVSSFDRNQSTEAFQASIDRFVNEMKQRKQTLKDTYANTYGDPAPNDNGGGGQQFEHTATGQNGEKIGWDGQKWVPAQ